MRLILLFSGFIYVLGLHSGHLPNGNPKIYVSSSNPEEDLFMIGHTKASFISKHWMNDIMTHLISNEKHNRFISYRDNSDLHIINKINELEQYIQENRKPNDYYMAWMPKCVNGSKDILFLVVCQHKTNGFCVKHVIQSPFWSPDQIESTQLKLSLEGMSQYVDMSELYENDIRYKLAWSTWYIEI
jgi:hypothetical protein